AVAAAITAAVAAAVAAAVTTTGGSRRHGRLDPPAGAGGVAAAQAVGVGRVGLQVGVRVRGRVGAGGGDLREHAVAGAPLELVARRVGDFVPGQVDAAGGGGGRGEAGRGGRRLERRAAPAAGGEEQGQGGEQPD